MVPLGDLPGGFFNSEAWTISADGSVIGGASHSDFGFEAFIWDAKNKMRSLRQVLIDSGIDMEGWLPGLVTGLSHDGSTIVGWGTNPSGKTEAWIAKIDQSQPDINVKSIQHGLSRTVHATFETTGNSDEFGLALYASADGVRFDLDDLIEFRTISPDPAGGEQTATFHVTSPLPSGLPYLIAVADPGNAIDESDEDNNSKSLLLPEIRLHDATTTDFVNFAVAYEVLQNAPPPFLIRAYLSADSEWDSGDLPLPGQLRVSDDSDRSVGIHGLPPTTPVVLALNEKAAISDDHRFVIIVADSGEDPGLGGAILEANETNNRLFAIPLLAPDVQMNKIGQIASSGFGETDSTASGGFTGAILRGTDDFERLESLDTKWPYGFKDEEPVGLRDEDHLSQSTVLGPTEALANLVAADIARVPGFWGLYDFRINDAYDSIGEHGEESLHFEGRALDFGLTLDNQPIHDLNGLSRLAGLAWLAGFDWVEHEIERGETKPHVHVSERAAFVTTIDEASLQDAVLEAESSGKISEPGIALALFHIIDGLDADVETASRETAKKLGAFERLVLAQTDKAIESRFASFLLANVNLLRERLNLFE